MGVAVADRGPDTLAPFLLSGGDSRLVLNPEIGLNKYFCPAPPSRGFAYLSSCTASPISERGFEAAASTYSDILEASSPVGRARRLARTAAGIEAGLLHYFGAADLARVILCPSGTDAPLATTLLVAAERPDEPFTAILPAASETGTGVPLAAACRVFDGPSAERALTVQRASTVEIPLRAANGEPLPEDLVNDAYAAAASSAGGRAIVYLTHGTKTGLIAPESPPGDADVIVDACQARTAPATVAGYLRRGWPVAITGSKFFGGPAFSGAVLFPRTRLDAVGRRQARKASSPWFADAPGSVRFNPFPGAIGGPEPVSAPSCAGPPRWRRSRTSVASRTTSPKSSTGVAR